MSKYLAKHSISFVIIGKYDEEKKEKEPDKNWYCEKGETFDTNDITLPDLADLIRDGIVVDVTPPEPPPEPAKGKKDKVTT